MVTARPGSLRDINVTPMIDVLLVLLVIFMIMMKIRTILELKVPLPAPDRPAVADNRIVLELRQDGTAAINGALVTPGMLEPRLRVLSKRSHLRIIYVQAAPSRPYRDVIEAVGIAKGAGWQMVGYMPFTLRESAHPATYR